MVYQYNSQIYLAEVALNVKDLESQTAFYHQLLGLEILNQLENQVLWCRWEPSSSAKFKDR